MRMVWTLIESMPLLKIFIVVCCLVWQHSLLQCRNGSSQYVPFFSIFRPIIPYIFSLHVILRYIWGQSTHLCQHGLQNTITTSIRSSLGIGRWFWSRYLLLYHLLSLPIALEYDESYWYESYLPCGSLIILHQSTKGIEIFDTHLSYYSDKQKHASTSLSKWNDLFCFLLNTCGRALEASRSHLCTNSYATCLSTNYVHFWLGLDTYVFVLDRPIWSPMQQE